MNRQNGESRHGLTRFAAMDLRKRDKAAICAAGSRSGACVRQPGQVRKEAATTGCGGSAGSFVPFENSAHTGLQKPMLCASGAHVLKYAARRFSILGCFGSVCPKFSKGTKLLKAFRQSRPLPLS